MFFVPVSVVSLLVASTVVPIFVWYLVYLYKYKDVKIPGPIPLPIFGNSLDTEPSSQGIYKTVNKYHKQYGPICRFFIGSTMKVLVANPEHIKLFLTDKIPNTKSEAYRLLKDYIGEGLLTSTGDKWVHRRKMITPMFFFGFLDKFVNIFNQNTNILIEKLKAFDGEVVDIYPLVNACLLDIICEAAMGVKLNIQSGYNKEYAHAIKHVLSVILARSFSFWEKNDFLFQFSPRYTKYRKSLKVIKSFNTNIIESRRAILLEKQAKGEELVPENLLDLLLTSGLDDDGIIEEIDTFALAGHDTVTASLGFTLVELAKHPKIQDHLYKEIQDNVKGEGYIDRETLKEMVYLNNVVKEGLRLYPAVPYVERRALEDCFLGDFFIPKDTTIMLYFYGMQRCPDIHVDPEKFNPARFEAEVDDSNLFSFLPFSAGKRNCIGNRFGKLEMQVIIAKICQHFILEAVPGSKTEMGFSAVISSKNGMPVKINRRK